MRRWSVLAAAAVLAGCSATAPPVPRTSTVTVTRSLDLRPEPAGPTVTRAGACPLLATSVASGAVGMRLARTEVLLNRGRVTGCRFYALQNSPLHRSERLPGPNQPVIEITSARFRAPAAARNRLVALARVGRNPQRAGTAGICYQQDFYPPDRGRDWACTFASGSTVVSVRTVVTSPALDVIRVARVVITKF